jgi:hypothetical protein
MSIRCVIHFCYGNRKEATIYRHHNGYPNGEQGVLADLIRFFDDVEKQCTNTLYGCRFGDPSYLAAKYVVWQAARNHASDEMASRGNSLQSQREVGGPLSFGSLGIIRSNPMDIDYEYFLDCSKETQPIIAMNGTI